MIIPVDLAYRIAKKVVGDLYLVDVLDLKDSYGFVFIEYDPKENGPISRAKAYEDFMITGWIGVDKKTGRVKDVSSAGYFETNSPSDIKHLDSYKLGGAKE